MRTAKISRTTLETNIDLQLNIDGQGQYEIHSGIGFINHMLTLFSVHSDFDLILKAEGDLDVDCHHTIEDIGIVLGKAFNDVLNEKKGIKRYSSLYVPMDEALVLVAVDISNRPYLVFNVDFQKESLGSVDTQMFKEFFRAFVNEARISLHINLIYGENDHHKIEAVFKGLARALKEATRIDENKDKVLSSKGCL